MKTLLSCLSSCIASPTAGVGKYARDKISTLLPRPRHLLNLAAFLLLCGGVLPTSLAQDLAIDTPRNISTTPNTGDGALLTLRANNIQVRAEWSAEHANFDVDDDGKLRVIGNIDTATNITVTVMVKDKFSDLNDAYTDLTAQAVIDMNLMPGIPRTIFVLGGYAGSSGSLNDVWQSSDGKNWNEATTLWAELSGHQAVVHNGTIYVLGGNKDGTRTNDVWSSTDGDTWIIHGTASWTPRTNHQAVVHGGTIYILGGNDGSNKNDVWASTDGRSWSAITLNANWPARQYHQAVSHQGRLYVLGGLDSNFALRNDVWSSADGLTWSPITLNANWPGRYQYQAVVHQNKIYVLGGNTSHSATANDVWSSVDGEIWSEVTGGAKWEGRREHQSVSYDNRIYVLGGNTGARKNDVWSSVDGNEWLLVTGASGAWPSRQAFQAIIFP